MPIRHLVTHSGSFHCDDAFAYATLRLALGLGAPGTDHRLTRTRDQSVIDGADIVWDVGAVFDAATSRFDHHQRGAPVRPSTDVPFSAAGLVWQVYGLAAVQALLAVGDAALAPAVAAAVEEEVIHRIDEIDNGFGQRDGPLGLSAMVADCNLPWNAPDAGNAAAEDRAFVRAADLSELFLRRRVEKVAARFAADALVVAAHAASRDPRLLQLDRKMPWQASAFRHGLPVIFAVYPVPNGNWMVEAMPPEPDSFAQRVPLPEAWAGLRDEELAVVSCVPDAVFVHPRRFVGAARSRAGAVALAEAALPPVS